MGERQRAFLHDSALAAHTRALGEGEPAWLSLRFAAAELHGRLLVAWSEAGGTSGRCFWAVGLPGGALGAPALIAPMDLLPSAVLRRAHEALGASPGFSTGEPPHPIY